MLATSFIVEYGLLSTAPTSRRTTHDKSLQPPPLFPFSFAEAQIFVLLKRDAFMGVNFFTSLSFTSRPLVLLFVLAFGPPQAAGEGATGDSSVVRGTERVADVLLSWGKLEVGDTVVAETGYGRVHA